MTVAFIGLGANLGDPAAQVRRAMSELDAIPKTRVLKCSSLYRSDPVGYASQPKFVNAVAEVETDLSPESLLDELNVVEDRHGRRRTIPNAPRTLDLDLLLFDDLVLARPELTVPHPRMHERAFVLAPLHEIAPQLAVPGRGKVADLLAGCAKQGVERMP